MTIEEHFGQEFEKIRLEANLSQSKLAQGVCSTKHIRYIEQGKRGLSFHMGSKLSRKLRINLFEVYFRLAYNKGICRGKLCCAPCDKLNICSSESSE